jgi:hypothetical protein
MKMKFFYSFIICLGLILSGNLSIAQKKNDSLLPTKTDSNPALVNKKPARASRPLTDTVNKEKKAISVLHDTGYSANLPIERPASDSLNDSTAGKPESLRDSTVFVPAISIDSIILSQNPYINSKSKAVFLEEQAHTTRGKEFLFYVLCLVVLILGLFRTFFTGYFKNLFRVYFNTSLRQTQLSDQLKQATLPSLILNIFFYHYSGNLYLAAF